MKPGNEDDGDVRAGLPHISATEPNTFSSMSSFALWVTVVLSLASVHAAHTCWCLLRKMRAVCLVPSPPVMPRTMTLESLFTKIDMVTSLKSFAGDYAL